MKSNEIIQTGVVVTIICVVYCILLYVHLRDQDEKREHCVVSESYDYVELLICLK